MITAAPGTPAIDTKDFFGEAIASLAPEVIGEQRVLLQGISWEAYLQIYELQATKYVEVDCSPTFPLVPKECLYTFLATTQEDEMEAVYSLRAWWQAQ